MASNRLRQIASVTVGGLGQLPLKANETSYKPSGMTREHHPGQRAKDGGYTEAPEPARLEVTLNDKGELDYDALNAVAEQTITIEYFGGDVEIMPEAWCSEPVEPDKGNLKAVFMSNESQSG